jgi:hypothetical protein
VLRHRNRCGRTLNGSTTGLRHLYNFTIHAGVALAKRVPRFLQTKPRNKMNKKDYHYAQCIMQRIDELDQIDQSIGQALDALKQTKDKPEAEKLAQLIYDMITANSGELAVETLVADFRFKIREWRKDLEKQFEEL